MLCGYSAKNAIIQFLSLKVFESIMSYVTAHDMWTKLEEIYGGFNLVDIHHLSDELI